MECRDTKLLMEAYWDRHLPPEMVDQIDAHVEECSACRAEFWAVNRLLAEPDPVVVPAGLRDRIMAAIEPLELPVQAPQRPASSYHWWMERLRAPWMGAMAACLTFFLLGWFSHHMWNPPKDLPLAGSATATPTPLALAAWTQHMALPGSVGPLPAIAQAVTLHRAMEAETPVPPMRNRAIDHTFSPSEPSPPIEEISRIVAGLSTLGA